MTRLRDSGSHPISGQSAGTFPFGPYARDDDFAGILADVYSCGACGRVAVRPVEIQLSHAQVSAA